MLELIQCPEPSCGALAEVLDRFDLSSTDGPVEHVRTRCINRHHFTVRTPVRALDAADPSFAERPRRADSERTH